MARPVKGDVVVVPFPFSDLTRAKRRPALVVASLLGDDFILSQITSRVVKDCYAVELEEKDYEEGSLRQPSNVRPNRLFTADVSLVLYRVGRVNSERMETVTNAIIRILRE